MCGWDVWHIKNGCENLGKFSICTLNGHFAFGREYHGLKSRPEMLPIRVTKLSGG